MHRSPSRPSNRNILKQYIPNQRRGVRLPAVWVALDVDPFARLRHRNVPKSDIPNAVGRVARRHHVSGDRADGGSEARENGVFDQHVGAAAVGGGVGALLFGACSGGQ